MQETLGALQHDCGCRKSTSPQFRRQRMHGMERWQALAMLGQRVGEEHAMRIRAGAQ